MPNNSPTKKEVSCKPLLPILDAAKRKHIELSKILEGVPYDVSYLLNKHERIEWRVWCRIIANLRPYFALSDYEQMGRDFVRKQRYIEGYIFHFLFLSAGTIAKIARGTVLKAGNAIMNPLFSCCTPDWEYLGKHRVRISMYLDPGYEQCPEWNYMNIGVMRELASTVGRKRFTIDHISITSNASSCEVSLEEEGFFAGIRKRAIWLFNVKRTFVELTESHEQLAKNYTTLEESKRLLQRETTKLTTAYTITKSIRQSIEVDKTLQTITDALVHDAGVASAGIKLVRDLEGNSIEAEAYSGIAQSDLYALKRPILINEEHVGELVIFPRGDADVSEFDELLNYLIPMINISVHDSLALRAVTDFKNNLEMKVDERTAALQEAQKKLSDIFQLQNRFFANISHEFRTPLTLILGPVKEIIETTDVQKIRRDLGVVHKNASRLLELVNQLLDLSKLESGNMRLHTVAQNVIPFLKILVSSFTSHAERKGITLIFNSATDEIHAFIDKDKIEKILTNVLTNAFKFTPSGGRIEVEVKTAKEYLNIRISDTGIGIPADNLARIFDRFYQVDGSPTKEQEGTGIGLSLTKELVELHKGTIEVNSTEGAGTTIMIDIPLGRNHLKPEEIYEGEQKGGLSQLPGGQECSFQGEAFFPDSAIREMPESGVVAGTDRSSAKRDRPLLLLVEDNEDVRSYITRNVKTDYRIVEAVDGEDGWEKSIEHMPDVIVSDVMMPGMDGFALCDKLKTDERTSHIPVILLTAKATGEDKIEGLAKGADDYIMKPFEPAEVKARIRNLIEQRKRIHDYFKRHGLFEVEEGKITPVDQKFLQNAVSVITKHMSDPAFGVESLAVETGVSRSVLLKKIQALVGEPPSELIKMTRLNKAAKLIEGKFGNISEIALEVGFNNPSYFAVCFKEQFGCSPSQYRRSSAQD